MTELTFKEYSDFTKGTSVFPPESALPYLALGLTGEAGEVAEKIKKIIRDSGGKVSDEDAAEIIKELGDVLWYVARLSDFLVGEGRVGIQQAALGNINKLLSRQARDKLKGSGDNR